MSHFIQLIVAPLATADRISEQWPELPRLGRQNGFSIFPVNAELIDARISPDKTAIESDNEFVLLTNGFLHLLESLSQGGELAYVETEYWAGVGGQGAVVCRDGDVIMPPTWSESGTINEALLNVPMTAHILGGCTFGRDTDEGVIGLDCQAHNYPGLYIVDGSIVPANPGVNPSLTITALAEYAMSCVPVKAAAPSEPIGNGEEADRGARRGILK